MQRYKKKITFGLILLMIVLGTVGCNMNVGRQNEKIIDFHNEFL